MKILTAHSKVIMSTERMSSQGSDKQFCMDCIGISLVMFVLYLCGLHPLARVTIFLLHDVTGDGGAAVIGGLLPLELCVVLGPVLELGFAGRVGLVCKQSNTSLFTHPQVKSRKNPQNLMLYG